MASACVNNISMSPENNLHSYGWLTPRISFTDDSSSNLAGTLTKPTGESEIRDPDPELEFEFRLEDPVAMLPADELFSDGKLVPLHLSSVKPLVNDLKSIRCVSSEITKSRRRVEVCVSTDPYLYSPKAPRCSSRWRELLGLKKLYQNSNGGKTENQKTETNSNSKAALKYFQHRNSKSNPLESSMSLPLLKDSDCESSSRVSLSSSSSGHEHEDLQRLSLDCENKSSNPISVNRNPNPNQNQNQNPARIRMVKARAKSTEKSTKTTRMGRSTMRESKSSEVGMRGVSMDSPRMNSSGKIVFHNLERSSSSPSSFNGGRPPKFNHHHHLHNNRVSPVLNVPVCSLIGFGPIFSSPLKNRTRIDNKFIH